MQDQSEKKKTTCAARRDACFSAELASGRGWDHGVFIPLLLMVQAANIPVVQLSVLSSLDPQRHLELGSALGPLRDEGVFILGSGMSYHNMLGFTRPGSAGTGGNKAMEASSNFQAWLTEAVCGKRGAERCVPRMGQCGKFVIRWWHVDPRSALRLPGRRGCSYPSRVCRSTTCRSLRSRVEPAMVEVAH